MPAYVKSVKLIDKGWKKIRKSLKQMEDAYVAVGFPGETSKTVKGADGSFTVASLAAVHEYGTTDGHIPSRPFMRMTYERTRQEIKTLTRRLYRRVLDNKISVRRALGLIGVKYEGEIKQTITQGPFEPLKTRIGTPLVDTGTNLRNNVTHKVRMR